MNHCDSLKSLESYFLLLIQCVRGGITPSDARMPMGRLIMEKIRKSICMLVCAAVLGGLLPGCGVREEQMAICKTAMFSWEDEYLLPEQEDSLIRVRDTLGCDAVYQQFSGEEESELVLDYLQRRKDAGQDIYYLAGASEWGIESDGESMLAVVDTAVGWNELSEGGLTGIVWDVEPYTLDEWDENPEEVMDRLVENCVLAYQKAKENGLSVIACIPNFYDRKGFTLQLERLISSGCDGVAVMNYNKADEAGQIAVELELVRKHDKGLINITELQKPGYHDLTEENTYYYDGVDAVSERWEVLREECGEDNLGFAWHYLKPVLKLLDGEESE